MPYGTVGTILFRRPFAGWVNQFHEPIGKPLFYIVVGAAVGIKMGTKAVTTQPYETRVKGSKFFALAQADTMDNPVYALPPFADGTHGEVTGTARVTAHSHGHDVKVEGAH
eukprot:CAMPEP_0203807072 /NCGR_PEP_ID=MMETSP0115-20131106/856_1 /ASSEMBLY_ACC=CAM_ASM_000227 /TAXON_ID=33651 /ORGANISM="Bicosoecid sp, Strain ms1" /LENGTH=110 /DNA_ID=CAMNT_0050715741 /DNA_START=34 /DNA_END=366 /DNA_ORIENTATION=-